MVVVAELPDEPDSGARVAVVFDAVEEPEPDQPGPKNQLDRLDEPELELDPELVVLQATGGRLSGSSPPPPPCNSSWPGWG